MEAKNTVWGKNVFYSSTIYSYRRRLLSMLNTFCDMIMSEKVSNYLPKIIRQTKFNIIQSTIRYLCFYAIPHNIS